MYTLKPVADETLDAVDRWLAEAPKSVPSPQTYARLRGIVRVLRDGVRDQAMVITGLQQGYALMKTQVRQEELSL